ncbi:MAG: hypothetical protein AAF362_03595 [Pseudomonadota bacterium]
MSMSDDLMLAILAMDSYNRGYSAGISGLGVSDASNTYKLGEATIINDSRVIVDENGNQLDEAAGFYAVAYELNGQKMISYRGTDNPILN